MFEISGPEAILAATLGLNRQWDHCIFCVLYKLVFYLFMLQL